MPICVNSYPKRNLHTARRQTRMPARHPHKIFAPPIGTATPNAIYTQQGAKPACQQDIHTKFSHLLLAQLPRTQFTHSKPPNPHARKTSTQNFRSSYWHSYPERNLHTARRQTRMPAGHQRKIFAAPIGTATPNAIYTQQAAKPECQEDIDAKFSHLLLAQLPRTQFTHSKPPNPHARKTSTRKSSGRAAETKRRQSVHQTPCRCSKSHACHAKAAAERRRPNDAKAYIRPPADAPSPTPATQKQRQSGGDQTMPKRTSDPLQMLQVPRLPRKSSDRAAETKRRQSVHQTPCRCSKSHACHAKVAAEPRRPNDAKAYIRPRADAPSPTPATQKQRQNRGDQTTPKRTSDPLQMLQAPRLPRKSSGRAAETKRRQSVHQTPRRCSKSHACHAKAAAERRRPNDAKAYIRPPADAPSPTPATQKQRQSGGDQTTPKRTSDPLQMLHAPRLPHKSSGRAAETKRRQSVHQIPCRCSKPHACHAKAATEPRRPNDAKAYIRPPADAPSPTPATQKQRQSGGDQTTPKRTSDPLQMLQVPRLPRKSSGRAAETKRRQSVHQTPCRCSKSHACHAKAAAEPSCVMSSCVMSSCVMSSCVMSSCVMSTCVMSTCVMSTCVMSTCVMSSCVTSSCVMSSCVTSICVMSICETSICVMSICVTSISVMSICVTSRCVPRTQFTHSAPPNPHASRTSTQNFRSSYWHSYPERNLHTASRQTRMPGRHRRKIFAPPIGTATPNAIYTQQAAKPACQEDINTQKQRQSGGDQTTPKRTSDPLQMLQVPRLPRKSSGRAAETKRRQSVHQTPCRCSKSHACHAKAATERRRPNDAKAYIRSPADAPSPTPATQKQRQSRGDQTTPKRTSDPLQMLQVPRLPRIKVATEPRTKRRQSVHQTPCRCSKPHACHAKAAAERRRPNDAKAYIRPRADAPSPTPATQKQRQSGGDQTTPKRTSDPLQMLQVPRLPRKSSDRAAETKRRQKRTSDPQLSYGPKPESPIGGAPLAPG